MSFLLLRLSNRLKLRGVFCRYVEDLKDYYTAPCNCVIITSTFGAGFTLIAALVGRWFSAHVFALFFQIFQVCLIGTVLDHQVFILFSIISQSLI